MLGEADDDAPTIVCVQAGNVNTGACDDIGAAAELARGHGAWLHVDGAFGLWAAVSPSKRHLVSGIERADSWAVDGHKWLNVPYDTRLRVLRRSARPTPPRCRTRPRTSRARARPGCGRRPTSSPSRHAAPAASRPGRRSASSGATGLADLVDRCCALAERFGEQLADVDGVEIGNEIVLNQVLVSFGSDERTDALIDAVQRDGTCWMGGTTWHGRRYMRISVSNWSTTEDDVDRSVAAIRRLLGELA